MCFSVWTRRCGRAPPAGGAPRVVCAPPPGRTSAANWGLKSFDLDRGLELPATVDSALAPPDGAHPQRPRGLWRRLFRLKPRGRDARDDERRETSTQKRGRSTSHSTRVPWRSWPHLTLRPDARSDDGRKERATARGTRTPSGEHIASQGEQHVATSVEHGQVRKMTFQVANITKPLASAGRSTAAKRHPVLLDDQGAYIEHKHTGRRVKLDTKGDVSVMRVNIMPEKTSNKAGNATLDVGLLSCVCVLRGEAQG